MFSTQGTNAVTGNSRLELRDRPHRADHRRAAGHVVLHLLHAIGRLDRDAARVKRDAFADQAQMRRRISLLRFIPDDDQGWRFGTSLRDTQQGAHAEFLHPRLIEHFAIQVILGGHVARRFSHRGRGQLVGRFVGQLPREILGFAKDAAAVSRRLQAGSATWHGHRGTLHRLLVGAGLVAIGFEIAQDGAFHRSGSVFRVRMPGFEYESDPFDRFRLQMPYGGPGDLAHLRRIELLRLACPGQKDAARGHARHAVQESELQRFAGHLAGIAEIGRAKPFLSSALEDGDHHSICLDLFQGVVFGYDLHLLQLCLRRVAV